MKELYRSVLNILPDPVSIVLLKAAFYIKYGKSIRRAKGELNRLKREELNLVCRGFVDNLKEYCVYGAHIGADLYIKSYFHGPQLKTISLRMPNRENIPPDDVIMICCVKNDVERIKKSIEHHKGIGVNRMVFVDNDSTDGTREYLEGMDVDLYSINEQYHAGRKGAWIKKIQDVYGYNRWYLVVDSDELLSYVGMENHTVKDLIHYSEIKSISRVRSILLDMYPNHNLYRKEEDQFKLEYDYTYDYRFFDAKSYYDAKDGRGYMVRGGPRKRVFGETIYHSEPLTKYPLCFWKQEDIWEDHRPIPHIKNYNSLFITVLKHYKFLDGDFEKYKKIAQEGNYFNNSANYKTYLSKGDNISFYYNNSFEFTSSESLNEILIMDKIDWSILQKK